MFNFYQISTERSPLCYMDDLSNSNASAIYVKRDDLYAHDALPGGSAVRKVEFVVPQLAENKITDLIVIGRHGSNYMLNLVAFAGRLGIACHCIFVDPFEVQHSMFLSKLHLANASTYGHQGPAHAQWLTDQLVEQGKSVYVSPYEGTNTNALMGGYSLMDELLLDFAALPETYKSIKVYVPVDSAVTFAGMLCCLNGSDQWRDKVSLVGVPVFGTIEEHLNLAGSSMTALRILSEQAGFMRLAESLVGHHDLQFSQIDDYSYVDGLKRVGFMKDFFDQTGIMVDPVYGFHAAAAMLGDVKHNPEGPYILVNTTPATLPYFNYPSVG